jgi:transcriptional regulator with XRE-family HTH domain
MADVTSLYERIARTDDGSRRLASARLRHEVLKLIHRAQQASGLNQVELARRLGIRKSAVNQVVRGDGNVRINTLAEYLHATGFEMTVQLVPAGQPRERVLRRRARMATRVTGEYVSLADEGRSAPSSAIAAAFVESLTAPQGYEDHYSSLVAAIVARWSNPATDSVAAHRAIFGVADFHPIGAGRQP